MQLYFLAGNKPLILEASDTESEQVVRSLRDAIFYGGVGIIFLERSGEGASVCVAFCKGCQAPLIYFGECESKTCSSCREKCSHEYIEGYVHGGSAGTLGVGSFCKKCGQGKPSEKPMVLIPHIVRVA